ncbi:MAG TPA: cupin, partial [Pseudolabrys sp.]|nr:cupin [Pseudolabrys sp.]
MAKAKRKTKATRARPRKSKKKTAAKPAARAKTRKSQRFVVSHHREEDFDQGLRPYSAYRDLGIAPATSGMVQAHVIRMTKPFTAEEVAIPHYHDVEFQMVYVLKGWFQSEFEG